MQIRLCWLRLRPSAQEVTGLAPPVSFSSPPLKLEDIQILPVFTRVWPAE